MGNLFAPAAPPPPAKQARAAAAPAPRALDAYARPAGLHSAYQPLWAEPPWAAWLADAIAAHRLAVRVLGLDDERGCAEALSECPICMLHYPAWACNTAVCCGTAVCTECYVMTSAPPPTDGGGATVCPICRRRGWRLVCGAPPSPLLDLHQHTDHEPPPPVRPPLITIGPMARVDDQRAARQLISAISGALTPSAKRQLTGLMSGALSPPVEPVAAEASPGGKKELASVPISTWIAIIAGVVVVTVIFELNWFFSVFLVVVIGRLVRMPGVLPALARAARRVGQHESRPPER
jgi:hypothetical protein